jgi:2,3-bisphosphoglycerate-dependent phosphoglycerate mutase
MKQLVFLLLVLFSSSQAFSQSKLTTVILLRHAEKEADGSKDPELSEAGKKRAERLADVLSKTSIDAIYSTNFKRTENTVAPLAKSKNIAIRYYDGGKMNEVDEMLSKWKGGTIVICGHSNTTPAIVNYLTGKKEEYKNLNDTDYGNLVLVTVIGKGTSAKVTWLRY